MALIPRVGPADVVPLKRVQPQDIGSGATNFAYGDAAGTVAQLAGRVEAAEQTANVARGIAGAGAALEAVERDEAQNPDHNGRAQRFETKRQEIVAEFRRQVKGGQFQADYDTRVFSIAERTRFAVQEGVLRRRQDVARGDLVTSVDALVTQAAKAENSAVADGLLEQAGGLLQKGVENGSITATERAEVTIRHEKILEAARQERISLGIADEAMKSDDPIAYVRDKVYDPKLLDVTLARVKDMQGEAAYARAQAERAQSNELTRRFHAGELTRAQVVEDPSIPAPLRDSLIYAFDRRDASVAATGDRNVITDQKVKGELRDLMLDPNRRTEARATDLNQFIPFLSGADLDEMRRLQTAPDPGLESVNAEIQRYTRTNIFQGRESPFDAAQAAAGDQFRRSAEDALERARRALKRKDLTDDEVEKVLDRQVQVYYRSEWGRNPKKRGFEANITPADQERIRQKFVAAGQPSPTYEDILDAWYDEQGFKPEVRE